MDGQNFNNDQNVVVNTTPEKKTDALAIVSMILGIVSIILVCCSPYVAVVVAIVGIVLSIISKKNNGKSGMGTAGLICSIVGIALSVIMIILAFIGLFALSEAGIDINSLY